MPRPQRCRKICSEPKFACFNPDSSRCGSDTVTLLLDEYEVIRLVDFEKLTHEECARQMEVSRTTVTEIYEAARFKLADCIVNGKKLIIEGGNYRICDGTARCLCSEKCKKTIYSKAIGDKMKIAVTYENGLIFQHFGHTEQFKFYVVENGRILSSEVVSTNGSGHGALARFLRSNAVDTLICGGIGGGAQDALRDAGIKLFGGTSGEADAAVNALLAGKLDFNPDVHCNHHENNGGSHQCGEHGCH